jgi:hypothetical protein
MAKTDSTAVVQTVACDLGNCSACRGSVLTLSTGLDAPIVPCAHLCHLPDAWREQAVLTPPCDQDVDLDELDEVAGDLIADRALENEYVDRVWS